MELSSSLAAPHNLKLRRHRRADSHGPGVEQQADVVVGHDGRLRFPPLLAAMSRRLAPGSCTQWRRHEGVDIVCIPLGGTLCHESRGEPSVVVARDDVFVLSTGSGLEYRWHSIGDEPAQVVMFWLRAVSARAPRQQSWHRPRALRVGELATIAGSGTGLATHADVTIRAAVVPSGTSIHHDSGGRRCYIASTLGELSVDGVIASPGDGIIGPRGQHRITALDSTEVVIVEAW